jgi:hypothetical protein
MNTSIYDEIFQLFISVLRRKVPLATFAAWLYEHGEIASAIESDVDEQLLTIDYLQPAATDRVDKIILDVLERYRPDLYNDERIRRLLCGVALGTADIFSACAELSWYRHSGYTWIPVIFSGIDSELDAAEGENVPWVAGYKDMAKSEAQKLIEMRYANIPCH